MATLKSLAVRAGREHGLSAASWMTDGNTTAETFEAIVRAVEFGDDWDLLPSSRLSGEWADDPTPVSLMRDLGLDPDDERCDDLFDLYEFAFYKASRRELLRVCRFHLGRKRVREIIAG